MRIFIKFPDLTSTLYIRSSHVIVLEPGYFYPNEHHPLFELNYCWAGETTVWIQEKPCRLKAGDWLLIKSGLNHRTMNQSGSPSTLVVIHFDIDDPIIRKTLTSSVSDMVSKETAERTLLPQFLDQLEVVVQNILIQAPKTQSSLSIHTSSSDNLSLQAIVLLILKEIMSIFEQDNKEQQERLQRESSPLDVELAHKIAEWLNNSVYTVVSVQDIADNVGLSRGQCTKVFTKIYGVSPRQYLTSLKLTKAKEMLIDSDMTIEVIAERLGFSSLSHFSRQFKRWTGTSPQQFRPKYRLSL
ncbi:helix-turn-helix domain-containing protein [Paenibacillus azoreducens]|uniref:AraC family transcriptional regulator n=1 Tax=Paenibacillus azoreducens TaxID=116718 RepID=A0A919YEI4_9BACL|nr:AraC family transcriptional regulator [Paenibacillus azoreducens]GIO46987.1 AraC family transcriptional regulator [Paenibacillus azoreducens]